MIQRSSLGYQILGVWENGYDKEVHSVPALVIAKIIHGLLILVAIPVILLVSIIRPKTAREMIETWRKYPKANQAAAEASTNKTP